MLYFSGSSMSIFVAFVNQWENVGRLGSNFNLLNLVDIGIDNSIVVPIQQTTGMGIPETKVLWRLPMLLWSVLICSVWCDVVWVVFFSGCHVVAFDALSADSNSETTVRPICWSSFYAMDLSSGMDSYGYCCDGIVLATDIDYPQSHASSHSRSFSFGCLWLCNGIHASLAWIWLYC